MSEKPSSGVPWRRVLLWAIWLFAAVFCVVAILELDRRLFWVETAILLSAAIIFLSFIAPTKRQSWSFIVALAMILELWVAMTVDVLLTAISFSETSLIQASSVTPEAISFVSVFVGLLVVAALVAAVVWLACLVSAEHILRYSPAEEPGPRKIATKLLHATLGQRARYGIVDNGEFKPTSPKSATAMLSTPGTIQIALGHAVVFERRGKVSQIAGPGVAQIESGEKCKNIVRLGPRSLSVTCAGALTRDGIPLVVEGTLVADIEPEDVLAERLKGTDPRESRRYYYFHGDAKKPISRGIAESVSEEAQAGDNRPTAAPPTNEGPEQSPGSTRSRVRTALASMAHRLDTAAGSASKSLRRPGKPGEATEKPETVDGGVARYNKGSICRAAFLPPGANLDQALEDLTCSAIWQELAEQPFDRIIRNSQPDEAESSTQAIEKAVLETISSQTKSWGIEAQQFRVDRLELSEKIQEEVLQKWKQAPRGTLSSEEARAQQRFLELLKPFEDPAGSFGPDADTFWRMIQAFSQIIGAVRRLTGSDGMRNLGVVVDEIQWQIFKSEESARRLTEALKRLPL